MCDVGHAVGSYVFLLESFGEALWWGSLTLLSAALLFGAVSRADLSPSPRFCMDSHSFCVGPYEQCEKQ